MQSNLLIQNARIASENSPDLTTADVLLSGGIIQQIGRGLTVPQDARVLDARGRILMPGMFDAHVHLREPGFESKETISTGTEAAINGGVTGVVMMPNTQPAIDSATVVRQVFEIAKRTARIPVFTSGCVTKDRHGKELAGPRALNDGPMSYRLGIKGSPACAEEIIIERDIRLAHASGAHVHIQHVSSKIGMESVRAWKQRGDVNVTAEVTPHHLLFTDEDIGDYDTHYKMNPPLRTRADKEALLQGLIDGVFDLIATDHAPHTPFEKSQDFTSAPNGITGLDTALVSLHHHFVATNKFGWDLIIKRYSAEPRRHHHLLPGLHAVQIPNHPVPRPIPQRPRGPGCVRR